MGVIELTDKVIVVTGGAQGIGAAIVRDCAEAGADVVVADIQADMAQQTAQTVAAATGRQVIAIQTDVTDLESLRQLLAQTLARLGQVDVLVNNVGWDRFAFFLQTTPEFWDKVISLNYKSVLNTCYTFLPAMAERKGGVIINIASDAGRAGSMGECVYSGCKGAVIAFSKALAREHARDNIRVNVVAPGITDTALLHAIAEPETGQKIVAAVAKSIPLGRRAGQPEEIAPAVVFLASDAAGYITGQVLSVNGGLTMVD
jgi:2-hydroxycyclohexanecarboxyl-CoA dehydrogenase